LDTNLTATAGPPAARPLHEICEAARQGDCGPFCGALPGDECVFTTAPASVPVTLGTPCSRSAATTCPGSHGRNRTA
jgi:hypothetical protein